MTAKKYLSRIRHIDDIIRSKLEVVNRLRELSTKVGSTITTKDKVQAPYESKIETIIAKIVDLERSIDDDIDKLIDIKKEVMQKIDALQNNDYKLLLALRYLSLYSWEEIAVKMHFTYRWTLAVHGRALHEIEKLLNDEACNLKGKS